MDFNQLCDNFLKSSEKIRFVGIINPSGNLILQKNRENTTSLLSDDETNMLIHYSFSRWKRLENIEYKLGKITETITKFEKVSTIMLFFDKNLFLISTDPKSNNSKIISDLWRIIDGKPAVRKAARTSAAKKKPARKAVAAKRKTAAKKKPARKAVAAKRKTAAKKKPARKAVAAKRKTAAKKKPARKAVAAKRKTAAKKKPARKAVAAKRKTAAKKKPARKAVAAKRKTAAKKKPARKAVAAKRKTAAKKKPARKAVAAKRKTAAKKKPARTSTSKKKSADGISKNQVSPELMAKLERLEEYANSLYQRIRK